MTIKFQQTLINQHHCASFFPECYADTRLDPLWPLCRLSCFVSYLISPYGKTQNAGEGSTKYGVHTSDPKQIIGN